MVKDISFKLLMTVPDFVRFFLLKTKDEACSVFLKFKAMVDTQFSMLIKQVQSDDASKFKHLAKKLEECGTNDMLICPHTSQQDGTVEHKHRRAVDTGLC